MMTFIYYNHSVVAHHRINVFLLSQRANHGDVNNARRRFFLRGKSAYDGITLFDTSLRSGVGRQLFIDGQEPIQVPNPVVHNLNGMYQH